MVYVTSAFKKLVAHINSIQGNFHPNSTSFCLSKFNKVNCVSLNTPVAESTYNGANYLHSVTW